MANRFAAAAAGALLTVGAALPMAVRAAGDTYESSAGRGLFAVFETRNGDNRTITTVFAVRGEIAETDGETFGDPAVAVWTTTWNTKKDKVRRAAFGIGEKGNVTVNVSADLNSGSVVGDVRVDDAVKDERYTLQLDLAWTNDGGKDGLSFSRTFGPPPDDGYAQRVAIDSDGNEAKDATARGNILRGSTDLANKDSADADIFALGETSIRVSTP